MEMPIFLWFEKKWICFSGFVVFNVLIMNNYRLFELCCKYYWFDL